MKQKLQPNLRFTEFEGDWENKKLSDVTSYVDYRGRAPIKTDNGHFLVTAKNIKKGFIDYECSKEYVAENDYSNVMSKGLPETGDIVFTTEAPMGNVALVDRTNIALAQRVIKFRGKEMISNFYLLHYMLSNIFQSDISKKAIGTTVQGISGKELHRIKISIPTLPEQQKIASFLSSVDDKIQQIFRKKELLEQYKKGVMQKIFAQELRFKPSPIEALEIGDEYPDWEEKKLGEVCNYKNGGSFEKFVTSEGLYNLISLNSIDINGKLKEQHKKVSITDNSLQKGDLIMVLSDVAHGNFLGLTDIIPNDEFVLNQRMAALKPKTDYNSFYLKTYINYNQDYFKLMGQGSSQLNLSKGDVENFIVKLPSLLEQQKIASFLSAIDEKIEKTTQQLTQTETFKKGLLQKMFV
jgi:type I restriction enzyme S subunit